MNSRDLCAIDYLEDLKNAWIISFKVEWRNKTINYIASVWRAYRKALDAVEKGEKYDVEEAMTELFSIANRWYIPGFLAWNPWANAQFYERNWWFQTELFVWPIREYDEKKSLAKIEVKNAFSVWDTLKIITPDDSWEEKIEKIYKITWTNRSDKDKEIKEGKLEEVEKAHWWSFDVWINMKKNPGKWGIVRKNVENKC
jgi:putative protease